MRIRALLQLAAIAFSFLPVSLAGTSASGGLAQYRFDSGKSGNGKTWISVSCYIGGVFVWADGMDCNGNKYFRRSDARTLRYPVDDPTAGLAPTHTGETEAGSWRSVVVRDASGIPVTVVGISESGTYYAYEGGIPATARYQ